MHIKVTEITTKTVSLNLVKNQFAENYDWSLKH